MRVQVDIDDSIWNEYVKLGIKKRELPRIIKEALKTHFFRIKTHRKLLALEGKVEWEGNLDELRTPRM